MPANRESMGATSIQAEPLAKPKTASVPTVIVPINPPCSLYALPSLGAVDALGTVNTA